MPPSLSQLLALGELWLLAAFVVGATAALIAGAALRARRTDRGVVAGFTGSEPALRHALAAANLRLAEIDVRLAETRRAAAVARAESERASNAKSMFVANISHELRTPLNAVLGFSEIIEREMFGPVGSPRYLDYARDIHRAASHLKSLIDDILDISRVEANKYELHPEWLDPAEALGEPLRMVSDRAATSGLRISTEFDPISPRLFADRRSLVQMALNLLSNALKFTEAGGHVILRTRLAASGELAIEVEDSGCGIPPEDLERVLHPFEQVDNEHTRRHAGAGLGLPLVEALIRLHEGTLAIDSDVGRGTTISLRFPGARVTLDSTVTEVTQQTGLCA